MARICLTEKQKQEAAVDKLYRKIADGLAGFQNREKLTKQQLGVGLGIGRGSVPKLLAAEDFSINVKTFLRVIYLAGFEVKRRDP